MVAGSTGRTGLLVVQELLRTGRATKVVALARNETKAAEVLPKDDRVQVVLLGESADSTIGATCADADAAIWCSDSSDGLSALGAALRTPDPVRGPPRLIMCSSAAITRPTWGSAKKARLSGAADIPIVRLNPNDILGQKRVTENVVRKSGAPYVILRPTGLRDDWPVGRPLFSQGDLAVGRTSRVDLASALIRLLDEPSASGKTIEMLSVAGYPKPASYEPALSALRKDSERGPLSGLRQTMSRLFGRGVSPADEATYGLLQQLLPGESQDSASLAMGQTYEQYDRGEQGRLGPRGQEKVPAAMGQ